MVRSVEALGGGVGEDVVEGSAGGGGYGGAVADAQDGLGPDAAADEGA